MAVEGIYNKKENVGEKIYFDLKDNGSYVTLHLVDEEGEHVYLGNVLTIEKNSGKIRRMGNVNPDFSFTCDSGGSVTID